MRFLAKVKYTKQLDNGAFKRVTEQYLFDALTFTDAEASVYEHLAMQIKGEFIIVKLDRFEVDGILAYEEKKDKFFLARFEYETVDDVTIKVKTLINDNTIEGAKTRLSLFLHEQFSPNIPTLKSIAETKIIDYFQQQEDEQAN